MQDEYNKQLRKRVKKIGKKKISQSPDGRKKVTVRNSSERSDRNRVKNMQEELLEDFPEGLPAELLEDFPEGLPEELFSDDSEGRQEEYPVDLQKDSSDGYFENVSENMIEDSTEKNAEKIPKELLEDFPEGIPEELAGRLSDDASGDAGRSKSGQSYRRRRRSDGKISEKEKSVPHNHSLTGNRSSKDKKESKKPGDRYQGNKKQRNKTWNALIQKTVKKENEKTGRTERNKEEQKRLRIVIAACAAVVVLLLLILGISALLKGRSSADPDTDPSASAITSTEIRHFSFPALLSDEAAVDNDGLNVSEFTQILQDLYDKNYILVDIYSLADVTTSEDGTTLYSESTLDIPDGKIPFVLSERDVSYPLAKVGNGYPSRMLLDDSGNITVEYQQLDGTTVTGAYDIVPILENFIAEHPDFSYNNARGVLGLTGYNGILGYRTTESLGLSQDDGNMYAQYGVFDVNQERENCAPVIDTLQQKGWHFACNGNNNCSYGAELALVQNDIDTWMSDISSLIGGTDIMIFPEKTDMGSWSEYTDQNQKYVYMQNLGFRYYCVEDSVNPFWVQIRDSYVRQGIKEIDTYEDYQEIMQS